MKSWIARFERLKLIHKFITPESVEIHIGIFHSPVHSSWRLEQALMSLYAVIFVVIHLLTISELRMKVQIFSFHFYVDINIKFRKSTQTIASAASASTHRRYIAIRVCTSYTISLNMLKALERFLCYVYFHCVRLLFDHVQPQTGASLQWISNYFVDMEMSES